MIDRGLLLTAEALQKGRRIVSVIGFSDGGKTFFINRLKHNLARREWACDPPARDVIDKTPEGLETSKLVPLDGDGATTYFLVDLAGESLTKAKDRGFREGVTDEVQTTEYLAALAAADAYVLVVPAAVVESIDPRTRRRDLSETDKHNKEMVEDFRTFVACIKASERRLREGGDRRQALHDLLESGLTRQEIDDAFDDPLRLRKAVSVLFSRADEYRGALEGRRAEAFDADPMRDAIRRVPTLFANIAGGFHDYRFDFLTSFEGHDTDTIEVDYSAPHYGAIDNFQWLCDVLDSYEKAEGHRLLRPLRGQLATRHALRVRRWIDGGFRRAYRERAR